jgi:hypothetical protein
MLIIEIALGIVLAVIILRNLDFIISIGGILLSVAIALALIAGVIYSLTYLYKEFESLFDSLFVLMAMPLIFYGICVMGLLAEKLSFIRIFNRNPKRELVDMQDFGRLKKYSTYLSERFGVGIGTCSFFGALAAISNQLFGFDYSGFLLPAGVLSLLCLRKYLEIQKNT